MAHPVEYIGHHPAIALCVCTIHLIITKTLLSMHVPPIVMECFQIGAWTVTILVGVVTLLSWSHRVWNKYFKK